MMATTTRRLVLFATKLSLLISAFSLRQVRSWVPRPFTGANHSRLLQSKDTSNNDSSTSSDDANKFSFQQRIDSGKSLAVGAVSSSLAVAPLLWIHDATSAQWEFDTDGAALAGGLFAVVYRYCIRNDTDNPQLSQGVVGAFAVCRTLARIQVPIYCTALPLQCGAPLGYVDWNMIQQLAWNGVESLLLFGAAAVAMEVVTGRGYISRFP